MAVVVGALQLGAVAAPLPGPEVIGQWTAPFEEGGAGQERCVQDPAGPDGQMICKPTAVNAGVLPDGRIWYADGLAGTESWRYSSGELGTRLRNSQSRVLELTDGTPSWLSLTQSGNNTAIAPGSTLGDDPWGNLGAPGRPGDGRVGSLWGTLGGPARNPSDPPDDPQANDLDFFCSDQAQLPDGRLLIAGGTDYYNEPRVLDRDEGDAADLGFPEVEGIRATRIFDAATNTYRQVGDMKFGRWYPTAVTLPDGSVSVFSGATKVAKNTQMSQVLRTETFDAATDTWTENYTGPSSETSLPMVARVMLMPNGKILYTGAGQMWTPAGWAIDEALWGFQRSWDPQTSRWTMHGLAPFGARNGAAQVMLPLEPPYDRGTVMDVGGTLFLPTPGSYVGTPITTLTTLDGGGNITNARTGNLNHGRWYSSAVTLPTGEVLAVSGADRDAVVTSGLERPIREAELYDPETGTWKRMASAGRDRTYHNAAVLLPDGRVLVGGHAPFPLGAPPFAITAHDVAPGITANNDRDSSFEVFSPPYLFRGPRPAIGGVQRGIAWGEGFTIETPDAGSISEVVLSRLPSAQHVTDSDARTLRLSLTATDGALTAIAPPSNAPGASAIAPPGYYYLFIMKDTPAGPVPSVARIVRLGAQSDPAPTSPLFSSDDPPPPDTSLGAPPLETSNYLNPPPPPPGSGTTDARPREWIASPRERLR
ncbi:MAG: galactose oxidase-like domain-containing protein [Actinomycetota bacterium]